MTLPTDDELEAAIRSAGSSNRVARLLAYGIPTGIVLAILFVPWIIGYGPAGYRLITSHPVDVHVLNLSGQDVIVTVPHNRATPFPAGTLRELQTLAGTFEIQTTTLDGAPVETVAVETERDALYIVGGGQCLAVFDVSNYYGGGGGGMRIAHRIGEDDRVFAFVADTTLLPRRTAPDRAAGVVHWIEPVDCQSLEPDNEESLVTWAEFRLRQRRERRQEQLGQ